MAPKEYHIRERKKAGFITELANSNEEKNLLNYLNGYTRIYGKIYYIVSQFQSLS